MRAREAGIVPNGLPQGPLNAITDVPGVTVGQITLHDDRRDPPIHTGVTVILPHQGDLFNEKLPAAVHTINGFGKAAGLEQVREMGTIEAPIALTNTLCVGRVWDGLVTWMLEQHPEIGARGPSVNVIVGECNDSRLNDMRGRHVTADHTLEALASARGGPVAEGTVGAGTGMICFGYKGGVGSASRLIEGYTLGVILVANFGRKGQLRIHGKPVEQEAEQQAGRGPGAEKGSVVIVIATDAPLTDRQLGRAARRAALGLARTGSTGGSGSGDFVLAFSTAQRVLQAPDSPVTTLTCLSENALDPFFTAVVEATEEAVLNALCAATPVRGLGGYSAPAFPVETVAMRNQGTSKEPLP